MSDKFRDIYRIESNRMPGWDYSGNGIYFITLVVQNRECLLGKIENGKMILSDYGNIVKNEWYKSFKIRRELFLDEYIIMPNHLHAMVILKKYNNNKPLQKTDNSNKTIKNQIVNNYDLLNGNGLGIVDTHGRAYLRATNQSPKSSKNQSPQKKQNCNKPLNYNQKNKLYRKPKSLSSFIGGYKSAINTKIDDYIDENHLDIPKYNKNNHFFQLNYYDHIIRNNDEYWKIKKYIKNNPKKWKTDKFHN